MPEPKVSTSTRLWSDEVALARARDEVDAIGPGAENEALVARPKRGDYRFSNGREFDSAHYPRK